MSLFEWKHEMNQLLNAGSEYVITEGRDSGTSQVFMKKMDVLKPILFVN